MTPQSPEQSRSTGKLGRNPFSSKPLKVGIKNPSPSVFESETREKADSSRLRSKESTKSDERLHFKSAARGIRYLLEGAFYSLALQVIQKLHSKAER